MRTFCQRLLTRLEKIGTCLVKYSQVSYARMLLDPPPSSGYNFTKISGTGEGQDSLLMGQYGQLGKVVDLFNGNKLAKARKTRTSPSTLGLKKFGLVKLWVKKVFWVKNFFGSKKTGAFQN